MNVDVDVVDKLILRAAIRECCPRPGERDLSELRCERSLTPFQLMFSKLFRGLHEAALIPSLNLHCKRIIGVSRLIPNGSYSLLFRSDVERSRMKGQCRSMRIKGEM